MSTGQVEWYSDIIGSPGTRWDDLRVSAVAINPVGQSAPPTLNADNGTLEFAASGTEIVAIGVQLPHSWKQGSSIYPHVHWRKKTEGAGAVVWELQYEFVNAGEVFTDSKTTLTTSSTSPYGADDGAALRHLISPWGEVAMTQKRVSCVGLLTISRLGDNSGDTYAGVAQLMSIDIHIEIDSLGSEAEYVKQNTRGGVGL